MPYAWAYRESFDVIKHLPCINQLHVISSQLGVHALCRILTSLSIILMLRRWVSWHCQIWHWARHNLRCDPQVRNTFKGFKSVYHFRQRFIRRCFNWAVSAPECMFQTSQVAYRWVVMNQVELQNSSLRVWTKRELDSHFLEFTVICDWMYHSLSNR